MREFFSESYCTLKASTLLAFTDVLRYKRFITATNIALFFSLPMMLGACVTNSCKSVKSSDCRQYINMQNDDINNGKPLVEASGLTYNSETNTLFTIVNKKSFIYELELDGSVIRRLKVLDKNGEGFFFQDIEGIAYVFSEKDNSTFAIAEESRKSETGNAEAIVSFLEIPNSSERDIELPFSNIKGTVILRDLPIQKSNNGVEGIAVDVLQNNKFRLYGIRETPETMKPMISTSIIDKFDLNDACFETDPLPCPQGDFKDSSGISKLNTHFDDYSGLHIVEDNTYSGSGSMFLISDDSKKYIEYDRKKEIIDLIAKPVGIPSIPQAEGITKVGNTIYIVSEHQYFESNNKIIQFFLDGLNFLFPAPSRFYVIK